MRESIGTAWILTIVITFIVLFSGYLAFSINYSKSYRVKDGIIERIHKHNGFEDCTAKNGTLRDIDDYLAEINYNAKGNCWKYCQELGGTDNKVECAGINGTNHVTSTAKLKSGSYNYCVYKVKNKKISTDDKTSADSSTAYYKVVVFFSLQIGNISLFSNFHTTGETGTLYYPKDCVFTSK